MIDDTCIYAQLDKGTRVLVICWLTVSFLICKHTELLSASKQFLVYVLDNTLI